MIANFFPNNPRLCALTRLALTILQPLLLIAAISVVFLIPHQGYLAFLMLFLVIPILIAKDARDNHQGVIEHFCSNQDCKIILGIGLVSLITGSLASILYDSALPISQHYWINVISNFVSFLAGVAMSMIAVLTCFAFASIYQWTVKTYAKYLKECEVEQV